MIARIAVLAVALWLGAAPAQAGTLRVAQFNVSLGRAGPGVLLKELRRGDDPQIAALAGIIRTVRPDILLLNEFDYDGGSAALDAFRAVLAEGDGGIDYPHAFSAPVNSGVPSGLDLDGDGRTAGPRDAYGYGMFPGQAGMAVLSRHPIDAGESHSFHLLRWEDFPGALLPVHEDGSAFPSAAARAAARLSYVAHWDLAVETPEGPLRVLAFHATPPVFDGPEDMNGRRNHDEIMFWVRYLDGAAFADAGGVPRRLGEGPFVLMGDANADPLDGDGRLEAIRSLLAHPRLQDPAPRSAGGPAAALREGGSNAAHRGDPALDTADWRDEGGPGNQRVDYVLPSVELKVTGAGVFWPAPDEDGHALVGAGGVVSSNHRLVWVDIAWP